MDNNYQSFKEEDSKDKSKNTGVSLKKIISIQNCNL